MGRSAAVHVVTTRRAYKGKEYRSHLLRRSYREGGKVKKETVANITALGDETVALVRASLQGKRVVVAEDAYRTRRSLPHGHVQAVLRAMRRLGFERLLASRPSRPRSLVVAMVAQRILAPGSKLAAVRAWANSSLAEELGIAGANEDELYGAMDWLLERKDGIEGRLVGRHVGEGERVQYDVSSSYVEGEHCELAEFGYSRDGKRGKRQVNWGLLTTGRGCPLGIELFPGNTADPVTLPPQVARLGREFGIANVTWVGDRRMITGTHIAAFKDLPGVSWITALSSPNLKPLARDGVIQPSLFDQRELCEFTHADYPGERLIACRNPLQAARRARKREELLAATSRELEKIRTRVRNGRLRNKDKIGIAAGKVLGRHKMGKHIHLTIDDDTFEFHINQESVKQEAALDGIYVIRTNLERDDMSAENAIRAYKDLSHAEDAFKTIKTDLKVRPIHHRLTDRVTAHFFICLLAYYVRWHMEHAWASLTFKDEHPPTGEDRDPVAPATRSPEATRKAQSKTLPDGEPASSFNDLLASLATITRNTNYFPEAPEATFTTTTDPTPQQRKALDLLDTITP